MNKRYLEGGDSARLIFISWGLLVLLKHEVEDPCFRSSLFHVICNSNISLIGDRLLQSRPTQLVTDRCDWGRVAFIEVIDSFLSPFSPLCPHFFNMWTNALLCSKVGGNTSTSLHSLHSFWVQRVNDYHHWCCTARKIIQPSVSSFSFSVSSMAEKSF